MELAEFLKRYRSLDLDFQSPTLQATYSRDGCISGSDGLGPGPFEMQSILLPTPASCGKESAQNFR